MIAVLLSANLVSAQELVHYWNFNSSETLEQLLSPSLSTIGGADITQLEGGSSEINFSSNTGQNFDVENLNARMGDEAGSHLRFNDPIGGGLRFNLPTTGYQEPVINYATRRSGSGAGNQLVQYTIDGVNFTEFTSISVTTTPTLVTLDFSEVTGTDNNPDFAIRFFFAEGDGGDGGNNRFDNFTLEGSFLPNFALIHYWNFNANATENELLATSYTEVGGASITHIAGGSSLIVPEGDDGQDFDVENLNARFGDEAAFHLRFNNPIGGGLLWSIPTSGHEGIVVNYATRRSGSGAGNQLIAYTTDGVTFNDFTTLAITTTPALETLDFSAIEGANDNPNFAIRILFEQGDGGLVGNNRFDNFSVEGFAIGGLDTAAPVATLSPSDNSVNQATDVLPTITFNEPVALVGGELLSPANIGTAVALKLDNSAGADVPFSATYADNTITITPDAALDNNQTYYLVLMGNTIEDLSGNVLADDKSTTFTTIAVQSVLNPGDFAVVAYRMNTSDIDDQFAFITFVDILPGTLVNIADNKYTSNPQPQCAGGLTWTAPEEGVTAGTVVLIGNDDGNASVGTITGSTFGLSSNGDQIMMYTGDASAANHVTALSSNGWVLENTSCSGSFSLIPAALEDGVSALNLSTAPDATEGNLVNGYYNGPQDLPFAALKAAILDPANWVGTGNGTPGQTWPTWAFGDIPAVVSVDVINQTTIVINFNRNISEGTATNAANYTGIEGLTSAQLITEGDDAKKVQLTYGAPFPAATPLSLSIANIESEEGTSMAAPFVFEFEYNTGLTFDEEFLTVNEGDGEVTVTLTLSNPSASSVTLVRKDAPWSTAGTEDFVFENTDLNFDGTSPMEVSVIIPITDDATEEQDEYFTLYLENATGLSVSGNPFITVYITDNDRMAPEANLEIELSYITSYDPAGDEGGSTVEVISYDPASQRLFATSAVENRFDIIDFSNPASPSTINSVDMAPYGGITSVAVQNGVVAVASPNADEQLDGSVVFFDTDGNFIAQVTAGALPDMLAFTPDGSKVLAANEGQPNNAYTIDPEGSVTVIDISGGVASLTQANATTLDFTAFNAMEAALRASGVRKTFEASTLSQDLEPEYITINENGTTAWVSLQENNAIAEIDIENLQVVAIKALGTKDYSLFGNGYDASDRSGEVLRANWPVKGFLIPDAIANYEAGGVRYIVTANEGDEKEYGPLDERTTVGGETLDPLAFPHAEMLQQDHNLGRFRISNIQGDTDGDGDFDELYAVGARSFSILNAETMEIVYDSGDDFEFITQMDPIAGPLFNASNDNNNFKNRSRAKGPEPEGLSIAQINGETYAFVTLERTGGLMVYNITDPNSPTFVDYKNTRTLETLGGDLGPEVVIYINPADSPDGKAYALISNEVSGTITVFEVLGVDEVLEPGECTAFRYYLADAPIGSSSSDIYGVELVDDNAELTYLTSVDYQAHLGFDEANQVLYLVNRNNGAFESFDINTFDLSGPIALSSSLPNVASVVVSPEGNLVMGDETSDNVYVVDVTTGNSVQLEGESLTGIFGGDLIYDANGTLYYASRLNGGELVEVLTNTVVGNMPAGVTGAALMPSGNIMTTSRNWDNLRVYGPSGSESPIATFNTLLDGEPIVVKATDLASGCTDNEDVVEGCYAFEVLDFNQGFKTNGQPVGPGRSNPETALGMPDASNAPGGFVSLGVGGSITLGFEGAAFDGPGDDIMVYETSFSGDVCGANDDEFADIALSQDGINFVSAGSLCRDGGVDIATAGLEYAVAIRITNSAATTTSDGYDVDGVVALNGCGPEPVIITGECNATEVIAYQAGTKKNGTSALPGNRTDASKALGEPEGTDAMVFVTLGYGGSITLAFDGAVPNEAGDDIEVVETTFGNGACATYPEYADVYVSQNGVDFFFTRTICRADNFVDIDEAGQGFASINYVRIDNNDTLSTTPDGFDVDGVRAIHNCAPQTPEPSADELVFEFNKNPSVLTTAPNPTSGPSTVTFTTNTTTKATLEVYDMSGRSVARLFNQEAMKDQEYRIEFNVSSMSNGLHLMRLTTDNEVIIYKFIIAR